MRRLFLIPIIAAAVAMLMGGCNLPLGQQDTAAIQTGAALTVQAQLTAAAPLTTATFTAVPFPSLPPVSTLPPTATATSICDAAQFISDVTVPDGTVMTQNQAFTKTWRLRNVGVCSWTPSYAVIFFSGDSMNGPAIQALSGNVNPGQTVDISVDLKAAASNGDYTGYWKLRNAAGVAFSQFFVKIKVHSATSQTVNLQTIGAEDGQVRSNGSVLGPPNTGDLDDNAVAEAFLSFDISGIPSNATITKVVADFASYDTLGNPFSLGDGCVRLYLQDYGTLDASDFFVGDPVGAIAKWCSAVELSTAAEQANMISALQGKLGSSRFQLRVQFRTPTTNNNNVADMIRFGAVKLTVTYSTP